MVKKEQEVRTVEVNSFCSLNVIPNKNLGTKINEGKIKPEYRI